MNKLKLQELQNLLNRREVLILNLILFAYLKDLFSGSRGWLQIFQINECGIVYMKDCLNCRCCIPESGVPECRCTCFHEFQEIFYLQMYAARNKRERSFETETATETWFFVLQHQKSLAE